MHTLASCPGLLQNAERLDKVLLSILTAHAGTLDNLSAVQGSSKILEPWTKCCLHNAGKLDNLASWPGFLQNVEGLDKMQLSNLPAYAETQEEI